jgi:5-methylcytosine-specific restriction endonuclease McrA
MYDNHYVVTNKRHIVIKLYPIDVIYVENKSNSIGLKGYNHGSGYRVFMFMSKFNEKIGMNIHSLAMEQRASQLTINYFGINKHALYAIAGRRGLNNCFYCNAEDCKMTIDHVVPVRTLRKHRLIGKDSRSVGIIDNAIRCCRKCNLDKESSSIHDWKKRFEKLDLHNGTSVWAKEVYSTLNKICDGSNILLYPWAGTEPKR